MDLDEWIWRYGVKLTEISIDLNMTAQNLGCIVRKDITPKLVSALSIVRLTNGQVTLLDLLTQEQALDVACTPPWEGEILRKPR